MRQRRKAAGFLILLLAMFAALAQVRPTRAQTVEKPGAAELADAGQPAVPVDPPAIRAGDSALVMGCAALTLLITPALGLFYGGMVRRKNVLATFQQSFILLGFVCVQWVDHRLQSVVRARRVRRPLRRLAVGRSAGRGT